MVLKSYRELCEVLEMKVQSSDSKNAQLKELGRYCKFHKDKYKFIIDEIYENPLPAIENRRNDVYGEHIEKLILHSLTKCKMDEYTALTLSRGGLFLLLHMVNRNYDIGRSHINQFSRHVNIPTQIVYDFYNIANTKMKSAVERTLKRLQNRCLINYTLLLYVKTTNGDKRQATEEEANLITETERQVLVDMGLTTKQDAFVKGKWLEFQEEINKRTEAFGVKYSYKVYHIYTTKDFRDMLLDECSLYENQWELSAKLYFSMRDSGKNIHNKRLEKFANSEPFYENDKCTVLPQYESCINKLIDITMDEKPSMELTYEDFYEYSNKPYTSEEFIEKILDMDIEELEW